MNRLSLKQVQASESMFVTNRLNEQLRLYLEHRNYVFDELDYIKAKVKIVRGYDKGLFYSVVFPNNNHREFSAAINSEPLDLIAKKLNSATSMLSDSVQKVVSSNDEFSEVGRKIMREALLDYYKSVVSIFNDFGVELDPRIQSRLVVSRIGYYYQFVNSVGVVANYSMNLDDPTSLIETLRIWVKHLGAATL